MKIAIDPGHGGNDTGAEGPRGLHESDVNLSLAELLAQVLGEFNIETKLTRACDVFVELGNRCHIANDWVANYFVSIHCNSNGPSARGIETLYVSEHGEALAEPIQKMLLAATGDIDRGLKYRSDLYVLNGTEMPAVLVEVGFISHLETEELLKEKSYQELIARAIAEGIIEHLELRSGSVLPK